MRLLSISATGPLRSNGGPKWPPPARPRQQRIAAMLQPSAPPAEQVAGGLATAGVGHDQRQAVGAGKHGLVQPAIIRAEKPIPHRALLALLGRALGAPFTDRMAVPPAQNEFLRSPQLDGRLDRPPGLGRERQSMRFRLGVLRRHLSTEAGEDLRGIGIPAEVSQEDAAAFLAPGLAGEGLDLIQEGLRQEDREVLAAPGTGGLRPALQGSQRSVAQDQTGSAMGDPQAQAPARRSRRRPTFPGRRFSEGQYQVVKRLALGERARLDERQ